MSIHDRAQEYREYMKSPEWKAVSEEKKRSVNYMCEYKGRSKCEGALTVHHDSYDNFGHESLDDLRVLCWKHHILDHPSIEYAVLIIKQSNPDKEIDFTDERTLTEIRLLRWCYFHLRTKGRGKHRQDDYHYNPL